MIQLNFRDAKPIYEQIKEEIRHLIVTGGLAPEDKLPSVRELAANLAINPNTIARAYQELEQEGYLSTRKAVREPLWEMAHRSMVTGRTS